jgi:hypothetical protein
MEVSARHLEHQRGDRTVREPSTFGPGAPCLNETVLRRGFPAPLGNLQYSLDRIDPFGILVLAIEFPKHSSRGQHAPEATNALSNPSKFVVDHLIE